MTADLNYIRIPGDKTHELPPLLVHSTVEAAGEQGIDLESMMAGAEEMLTDMDADEEVIEQRKFDLATSLAEQYRGLIAGWSWGDSILEWIRQCEITFEGESVLRSLLHPDVWPHASRSSFVTLLVDKQVPVPHFGPRQAVGLRLHVPAAAAGPVLFRPVSVLPELVGGGFGVSGLVASGRAGHRSAAAQPLPFRGTRFGPCVICCWGMAPSHSRRKFLRSTTAGSSLVYSLAAQSSARYDLLIRGGRVVDPSQNLSAERDIGISKRRIAAVEPRISETDARQVLDARGKIVTPGLIDIHVHVYDGVAPLGIPADPNCIAKGVTTAVDAGSAGAHTFPGLRKYVINVADTRIYALLNISVIGQSTLSTDNPWGELLDLRYANAKLAIRTIEQNRDVILGVKIRMTRNIAGDHDLKALGLAREAADAVGLPLMVHIGGSYSPVTSILSTLKKGDIITHSFRGGDGGILDSKDRVLPEVRAAIGRGVHMDIGHGAGSFSFDTAEKTLRQGILPGTISSDVHEFNVNGPVFDLATTLSKFLHLGLTLEQVVERATTNAANAFHFTNGLGTLRVGAEADVAVFSLAEGNFEFTDSLGAKRTGHQKLVPVATVKGGKIYGSASIPVVRA